MAKVRLPDDPGSACHTDGCAAVCEKVAAGSRGADDRLLPLGTGIAPVSRPFGKFFRACWEQPTCATMNTGSAYDPDLRSVLPRGRSNAAEGSVQLSGQV